MSPVLYALVVWMLASVPFALCIGRLCSLNQLSLDADAAHIAPGEPLVSARRRAPRRPLGAAQPDGDMTPA
jgi:hypothetical protein